MRHVVGAAGIYYRVGGIVFHKHEGARKKREPEVYGDKAEYVIKRQKRQLFQAALIVL